MYVCVCVLTSDFFTSSTPGEPACAVCVLTSDFLQAALRTSHRSAPPTAICRFVTLSVLLCVCVCVCVYRVSVCMCLPEISSQAVDPHTIPSPESISLCCGHRQHSGPHTVARLQLLDARCRLFSFLACVCACVYVWCVCVFGLTRT